MPKRFATDYPGVFYREVKRRAGRGSTDRKRGDKKAPEMERVYYAVFKKEGKVCEEKVGKQFEDKMTPAIASRIRADRIQGKRPSRKEVREKAKEIVWTVEALWVEYKRQRPDLKGLGPEENRFKNYIARALGKKQPQEIAPLDLDRIRLRMLKAGKSPQSAKLVLALVRRICNFGKRKGLAQGLSFEIEMPKVSSLRTEDLSDEQLGRLLVAIEKDEHPQAGDIMKLALYSGMRRGEMFRLQWDHLDFERGFIRIVNPKGGRDETIPMNDQARALLESIPRTDSAYVFPGRSGGQRRDIHKHVNAIKTEAGLPKDFRGLHGLRHAFASNLASSGKVDLYTIQRLLTHKDPTMTQRYAHLRDEALRKASELAGELVAQAVRPVEKEEKTVRMKSERRSGARKS